MEVFYRIDIDKSFLGGGVEYILMCYVRRKELCHI